MSIQHCTVNMTTTPEHVSNMQVNCARLANHLTPGNRLGMHIWAKLHASYIAILTTAIVINIVHDRNQNLQE